MPKSKVFDDNLLQYENWFIANKWVYQSELKAVQKVLPKSNNGIEIGIGSGLFAKPLGITEGIDPSRKMREKAQARGLKVLDAVAENLPYPDQSKDYALMVTTICFVDNISKSLQEANRILKKNGNLIIGFIDKNSLMGKQYLEHQHESVFYSKANFLSTQELFTYLEQNGFKVVETYQTIFGQLSEIKKIQEVIEGYGKGSFVVINAQKEETAIRH